MLYHAIFSSFLSFSFLFERECSFLFYSRKGRSDEVEENTALRGCTPLNKVQALTG
jgi:hypothetical protein